MFSTKFNEASQLSEGMNGRMHGNSSLGSNAAPNLEIENLKTEKQGLKEKLEKAEARNQQIADLEKENQALREKLQKAEEIIREAELKRKRKRFIAKSKQEGWHIKNSSPEDIEFLFEEFGSLEALQALKGQKYSSFDDFTTLDVSLVVEFVGIGLKEASKLIFNIELAKNGIFTREEKGCHLRECILCRNKLKTMLEEYGVAREESQPIADALAGLSIGEVLQFSPKEFLLLGINKSSLSALGEFFSFH